MKIIAIEEHFATPMYREKVGTGSDYRRYFLTALGEQLGHDIRAQLMDLGEERLRQDDDLVAAAHRPRPDLGVLADGHVGVDPGRGRVHDGHSGPHPVFEQTAVVLPADLGQLHPVVHALDLARVGGQVPTIALLYDGELLGQVPAEPHDRPVRAVVRPSHGLTWCGISGSPARLCLAVAHREC